MPEKLPHLLSPSVVVENIERRISRDGGEGPSRRVSLLKQFDKEKEQVMDVDDGAEEAAAAGGELMQEELVAAPAIEEKEESGDNKEAAEKPATLEGDPDFDMDASPSAPGGTASKVAAGGDIVSDDKGGGPTKEIPAESKSDVEEDEEEEEEEDLFQSEGETPALKDCSVEIDHLVVEARALPSDQDEPISPESEGTEETSPAGEREEEDEEEEAVKSSSDADPVPSTSRAVRPSRKRAAETPAKPAPPPAKKPAAAKKTTPSKTPAAAKKTTPTKKPAAVAPKNKNLLRAISTPNRNETMLNKDVTFLERSHDLSAIPVLSPPSPRKSRRNRGEQEEEKAADDPSACSFRYNSLYHLELYLLLLVVTDSDDVLSDSGVGSARTRSTRSASVTTPRRTRRRGRRRRRKRRRLPRCRRLCL